MKYLCALLFVVLFRLGFAQSSHFKDFYVPRAAISEPVKAGADYNPVIQNMEMPKPGGDSYRGYLLGIKQNLQRKYPRKNCRQNKRKRSAVPQPVIERGFKGNNYNNSVPNDNNMAVSDGGILLSAINSTLWAWDVQDSDTLIFTTSLSQLALPLMHNQVKFDPKLTYDPDHDRFILVFLNGFTPNKSAIILAFSSTNDPRDPWYLFSLSGNPLNDNTWSDYPAIAITKDELFITMNLLYPDSSWQTGFKQSIVWQVDKNAVFSGDTILHSRLWYGINFDAKPIRNLNPVKGGLYPHGPNMYFLSNRNFDLQNDTIFIVEITGNLSNTNAELKVKYGISDVPYGVPPFARQANGHTFDTNDGRILGAFIENKKIQFVGNTAFYLIDPPDTFLYAAIYHGFADSLHNDVPSVSGHIIYDPDTVLDLGYPNIAFAGNRYCDEQSVISFNHTAPTVFSGSSCIYYSGTNGYSDLLNMKQGDNYVNILSGTYERWGDYTGIQRKFGEPGKIWCATSYGDMNKRNATWITELSMPATGNEPAASQEITVYADAINQSMYNLCDASVQVMASGGKAPYSYLWDDPYNQTTPYAVNLCKGTYSVTVSDAANCQTFSTFTVEEPMPASDIFPNPSGNQISVRFSLDHDKVVLITLSDVRGRLIKILLDDKVPSGENIFTFSTSPLATGSYILRISSNDEDILIKKFLKI